MLPKQYHITLAEKHMTLAEKHMRKRANIIDWYKSWFHWVQNTQL
uniref:Uncharacterized protein n=1 Tax=Arundo donax TaxID=35708 RepID=A0A0A8YHA4_ARUDO